MNDLSASIIIPVYQAEEYIRQCLDSIINQTFKDFEVIIIDDGSTDGSANICDEYAAHDSRIHVFHQKNQGVTAARRNGLQQASGNYIFWVDADDYVEKDWLNVVFLHIEEYYSDIILWNSVTFAGPDERIVNISDYQSNGNLQMLEEWKRNSVIGKYSVLWTFCASRELWSKIQFPENITYAGEDGYLSLNLFLNATSISVISQVLYHHRDDSVNSISNHQNALYYYDNYQLWDYRYNVCQQHYPDLMNFCGQRALSAAVKAYCFDLYLHQLKNTDRMQMEKFFHFMAGAPIRGRLKEKFLSWAIRNKHFIFCRVYIQHKLKK